MDASPRMSRQTYADYVANKMRTKNMCSRSAKESRKIETPNEGLFKDDYWNRLKVIAEKKSSDPLIGRKL